MVVAVFQVTLGARASATVVARVTVTGLLAVFDSEAPRENSSRDRVEQVAAVTLGERPVGARVQTF